MKKNRIYLIVFMFLIFMFTGCEEMPEKGIYKEGTYFGTSEYELVGMKFTTTATIYVNDYGFIKSVFIDSTCLDGNVSSTRKSLKNTNALSANPEELVSNDSWDKQIDIIEKSIIKEQDLNFIKWENDEKTITKSIDGVTMPIKDVYEAVNDALMQAK